jgi:hypothetical protein
VNDELGSGRVSGHEEFFIKNAHHIVSEEHRVLLYRDPVGWLAPDGSIWPLNVRRVVPGWVPYHGPVPAVWGKLPTAQ